jgi:hypothetical protein
VLFSSLSFSSSFHLLTALRHRPSPNVYIYGLKKMKRRRSKKTWSAIRKVTKRCDAEKAAPLKWRDMLSPSIGHCKGALKTLMQRNLSARS